MKALIIEGLAEVELVNSIYNVDGTNNPGNNFKNVDRVGYPGSKVDISRSRAQSDNCMCIQNTEPHHCKAMDVFCKKEVTLNHRQLTFLEVKFPKNKP